MEQQERAMTIARGLSRLKTIKAQLNDINNDILKYAAWNNRKKHPLGDNKANVEKTHDQAQEKINSLYQKYNDLIHEYRNIKISIDRTNMVTTIEVADTKMTVHEAILYKREIGDMLKSLVSYYASSVKRAEDDVKEYNYKLNMDNFDESTKRQIIADVSYFINNKKIKEIDDFVNVFLNEIDGELNIINAITPIIWE